MGSGIDDLAEKHKQFFSFRNIVVSVAVLKNWVRLQLNPLSHFLVKFVEIAQTSFRNLLSCAGGNVKLVICLYY